MSSIDFDGMQQNLNDLLKIENAVLHGFEQDVKRCLGKEFRYLSSKPRVMIKNVDEIRRLIWLLLN